MILYQLDLPRFLQVYIVQGVVGIIWGYIAYRILKRGKKRLNLILVSFYFTGIMGIFLNFIYAPLTNEFWVYLLNFFTNFCFFVAPIFLVVFEIVLLKSNVLFGVKKQLFIVIGYGILLCGIIFIPGGVTISQNTDWKPVWSITYFIYAVVVTSVFGTIPSLYFGLKIYKKFENYELRKRWILFIGGVIAIYIFTYGTFLSNTLNSDLFRSIWSVVALTLTISGPILLYYGVGKQI
jgi:hypothetical protein